MKPDNNSFDAAIRAHDEAVAASGLDVWIGAEPTFTNRQSESPEWLSEALGETKQAYACRIIKDLRDRHPGSIILRQYAGEPKPRWSLHDWQPEGKPYDGLPDNLDEARRRIAERFVVEEITPEQAPDAVMPPDDATSDYCLDLRRI